MKTRFFAPQFLSLMGIAVSISSFGQTDNYIASNKGSHIPTEPVASYAAAPASTTVAPAVEEGLAKSYPQATNAKWTRLDNGFQASFLNAGQKTTAVFSEYGKFSYAITELSADKIPAEVSSFIKKEYPGYKLVQAVSVRDNVKTVYQTIIQHGTSHIKIKSIGEDLEVSTLQNTPAVH